MQELLTESYLFPKFFPHSYFAIHPLLLQRNKWEQEGRKEERIKEEEKRTERKKWREKWNEERRASNRKFMINFENIGEFWHPFFILSLVYSTSPFHFFLVFLFISFGHQYT